MTDIDPALDLVIERNVPITPQQAWEGWTNAEVMKQWFTPAPYGTEAVEIDVRPGGIFRIVMKTPEGELMDQGAGCILEAVENERIVWTGALGPDFRPTDGGDMPFTAEISFTPDGDGTLYRAVVRHGDPAHKAQHEEMGFVDGWGAALDQLVALYA